MIISENVLRLTKPLFVSLLQKQTILLLLLLLLLLLSFIYFLAVIAIIIIFAN